MRLVRRQAQAGLLVELALGAPLLGQLRSHFDGVLGREEAHLVGVQRPAVVHLEIAREEFVRRAGAQRPLAQVQLLDVADLVDAHVAHEQELALVGFRQPFVEGAEQDVALLVLDQRVAQLDLRRAHQAERAGLVVGLRLLALLELVQGVPDGHGRLSAGINVDQDAFVFPAEVLPKGKVDFSSGHR